MREDWKEVALRKESVDRNSERAASGSARAASLSARRAWIEICGGACARPLVAWSLSARRAWIEISGVDFAEDWLNGRSPQGERG